MSDTCTTKVLYEDGKRYVVSLTNSSDGTGEYRIKKVTDNLRLKNIKYSLGTMKALVELESSNIPKNSVTMTYAASGSSGITVADNDNIDFGTGNFTLRWKGALPDWTPSATVILAKKISGGGANYYAYEWLLNTDGTLRLYLYRNDNGTAYTASEATGLTDGTSHEIVCVVTRETASVAGSVVFYIDGVQLGSSRAITAVNPPVTISNTGALYLMGNTAQRMASSNSAATLFNRALSAAEVRSLYIAGVAAADKYGSQTPVFTWTTFGDWYFSGDVSGAGGVITFPTSAASQHRAFITNLTPVRVGQYWLLEYEVISNDRVGGTTFYLYGDTVNKINPTNIVLDETVGVHTIVIGGNTAGTCTVLFFEIDSAITSGSLVIDNIKLTSLGATLDLEPEGIEAASWQDSSTNNLDGMYPAAGCTTNLLSNPYKPYILSGNGEINVDTDMSGKLITDIFLTTIGHASGATYNIILDCEKF